jgi:NADPH:quinone reductase-like Zn-dependent oxidoreductase
LTAVLLILTKISSRAIVGVGTSLNINCPSSLCCPARITGRDVSGVMMRLSPSGDVLAKIGRLLEEGTIRPDVATVYALKDVAQAWKDIAENLPRVHGMSPSGPKAARAKSHGKIVLRVA